VTRTKHRNTRLEYREKAKCKIGREKRARMSDRNRSTSVILRKVVELLRALLVLSVYREEANTPKHTREVTTISI
jgi:hypothetical protein